MPADGQLKLVAPSWFPPSGAEVSSVFPKSPVCSNLSTGASVACVWDLSTLTLTLTGLSEADAGSVLEFGATGYRNPYDPLEKTGYQLITTDSSGNDINVADGLSV